MACHALGLADIANPAASPQKNNLIAEVSSVQLDLNDRGVMQTTDKHIFVTDVTGQKYLVTVSKVIDI